jgi:uncharacterized protein YpiB (UPF0302 family)
LKDKQKDFVKVGLLVFQMDCRSALRLVEMLVVEKDFLKVVTMEYKMAKMLANNLASLRVDKLAAYSDT